MRCPFWILPLLVCLLVAGCTPTVSPTPIEYTPSNSPAPGLTATLTVTPSLTGSPTPTPGPTSTPQPSGPLTYPDQVNPLTGLPVADPSLLAFAPGLVSISNAPVTARPQAGLSYAAQVYEFYIGEGATRFLSVFYGNLPPTTTANGAPVEVGPIRSGRLPYETLRYFYNGFLVFASASDRVLEHLDEYQIVQNPNIQDINGASISIQRLLELGQDTAQRLGKPTIGGLRFDPIPPSGGKPASKIWMAFHYYDQIFWKYDPNQQAYTRWQDDGDGTPLRQAIDRLNQKPLAYQNVIVLFTNYARYTDTFFNIDFKYVTRWPALLFRDGQMYPIYWTTRNEDFEKRTGHLRPPRFIDYNGNAFALKPGQTWIEIMQLNTPYFETEDSQNYFHLRDNQTPGSGVWAVYFTPPEFQASPTPRP